jgi:glycosyltransferase 2 family protein
MEEQVPLKTGHPKKFPLWRFIGTLLSFVLFVYLISSLGWNEFMEALKSLPVLYFWISLGAVLLSRMSITLRWYVLMRSAGLKMGLKDCTRLVFMGLFASNFLPSTIGGDLVRMAGALQLRMDAGASAASLVADRLVGMAGMATLLPVGLSAVLKTGSTLASFMIIAGHRVPGLAWLRKKAGSFGSSLWRSLAASARNPAGLFWAMLCTYGHMFFTFSAIWLLLSGLGQPLSLWWIGGLWSLSYFVSLLPVSINGLGLQELSITYLYTQFGGVPMQTGLALAVLLRVLFSLSSLPGVVFLPEILRPLRANGITKENHL